MKILSVEVPNYAACHQPVPDEQHDQRADRRGDEARALVRTIMADGLADPGGEKRADDAEHGGEDEAARIVGARREQPRDDAGDKADNDDPDDAAHDARPPPKARLKIKAGRIIRLPSAAGRPASDG